MQNAESKICRHAPRLLLYYGFFFKKVREKGFGAQEFLNSELVNSRKFFVRSLLLNSQRDIGTVLCCALKVLIMAARVVMMMPAVLLLGIAILLVVQVQARDISKGPKGSMGSATLGLCASLVEQYGYPCTEYTVQTEDGYLLGVQNIPRGLVESKSLASRQPVFLQHGLMGGGDNFLVNGPGLSLGYFLADAGFDVWIGNIRGIAWSHGHVSLQQSQPEFWDYSWDDLAAYDFPAMIDFVYNKTSSKITYIGHSQGTTMYMAGLTGTSKESDMTNKMAGAILLCPIAYMSNTKQAFAQAASAVYLDKVFTAFGPSEFTLNNDLGKTLLNDVCSLPHIDCSNLFKTLTGDNCCINVTRISYYGQFFPQPSSSKNIAHFSQMIRTGTFTKFDYGTLGNMEYYNQATPPVYNISTLPQSIPLFLVTGGIDDLADPTDIQILQSAMSNMQIQILNIPNYGHVDIILSTTAYLDVYNAISNFIKSLVSTKYIPTN